MSCIGKKAPILKADCGSYAGWRTNRACMELLHTQRSTCCGPEPFIPPKYGRGDEVHAFLAIGRVGTFKHFQNNPRTTITSNDHVLTAV